MNYTINIKNWGRIFTVPCNVVDKYIKLASGNAVKVLLCILCGSSDVVDSEELSKQLGVALNEVDDSIAFWEQVGIFNSEHSNIVEKRTEQIPDITHNTAISTLESINPTKNSLSKKTQVKLSPREMASIIENSKDLAILVENAQSIFKRPITYTEQGSLINLFEYYGFPVGVILMLLEYCEQAGKSNINYIEAVARNWAEREITTHEEAEKEIIRLIDNHTIENKLSSMLELTSKLTPKQKEFIESWISLGMNLDMISLAHEKCVDSTNKLSFPYMNKIITSWAENGIKTKEQALLNTKKPKKETDKNEHSYDLDEFDKFTLNYTPTIKGE